jgi:hypothetical protein
MDKKALSEKQLNELTNQLQQASLRVEQISEEVSKGLATKGELEKAIDHLKEIANAVKIKQAKDKVLSGWKVHHLGINEFPKEEQEINPLLILIAIIAIAYLVLG